MEKTKKIDWKLEDNRELNKVFKTIDIVIMFVIILSPIITSLVSLCGVELSVLGVFLVSYFLFLLSKVISFSLNLRFFKFRKLDLLEILAIALVSVILLVSFINKAFNFSLMFVLGFFIVFIMFTKVDKTYYKALLYTFVLTIVVCSIMGVCDLHNNYMPGFEDATYPMSLQFYNSNYAAYITVIAIILNLYILSKYKTIAEQIIFWISFAFLNVALFINGCFSAETAVFAAELLLLIYLWIKNRKCPWIVLFSMLISIASSFVWIKGTSTSGANYMFEMLAFLDGKWGTTLVVDVSTFFDKLFGTGIIYEVIGSDGWDRGDFAGRAIKQIFSSPKSFLFGYGAQRNYEVFVHNVYLHIWLEYGFFALALYISIFVVAFIRLFKTKLSSHNIYLFALVVVMIAICNYFGCLNLYSTTFLAGVLAVWFRKINDKYAEKKLLNAANHENAEQIDVKAVTKSSQMDDTNLNQWI